jgi:hypothetical protein
MVSWPLHLVQCLLVFLVLVAPLPLAASWVERLGSARHSYSERLLAVSVFWVVIQLSSGIMLGSLHLLTVPALVTAAVVILVTGLLMRPRVSWSLPRVFSGREAGILMVVVVAGLVCALDLIEHPTRNFDSLAYHLPVMARWVASSHFEIFADLGQVALYPSNWELLSTLAVLPLHEDLLVSAVNLFAWSQLGIAVVVLARRLGASRESGALVGGLMLTVPSVIARLDAIQPDIVLAGLVVTGLAFLTRGAGPGRNLDAVVVILCAGILPGLKLSGPVFVIALLVVAVLIHRGAWREKWEGASRAPVIAAAIAALFLASFWYLRNLAVLGNPLGEIELTVFGATIFEGEISRQELGRGALAKVFRYGQAADWGVVFTVIRDELFVPVLVMLVGALVAVFGPRDRQRGMVAVLIAAGAILYWNTPYSGDNGSHGWQVTSWIENGLRYGFVPLGLLAALAGAGLDRHRVLGSLAFVAFVLSGAWTVVVELRPSLVSLAVFVLIGFGCAWATMRGGLIPRRLHWPMTAAAILALALMLFPMRETRAEYRLKIYGQVSRVLETGVNPGAAVAVLNSQAVYMAAGDDWSRPVFKPGLPEVGGEAAWLKSLRGEGVEALLVSRSETDPEDLPRLRSIEAWLLREDSRFELLHDYESERRHFVLYALRPVR